MSESAKKRARLAPSNFGAAKLIAHSKPMQARETIQKYFAHPSALRDPDDQRIYRLLVESGWITAPEQEQLELGGSCLKDTPLCRWVHREASTKKRCQRRA
jgi:hypothetical protein